jgi:platelet-activating factor acetylhydrolase isoform II
VMDRVGEWARGECEADSPAACLSGNIDPARLIVAGHSFGGGTAVTAASQVRPWLPAFIMLHGLACELVRRLVQEFEWRVSKKSCG